MDLPICTEEATHGFGLDLHHPEEFMRTFPIEHGQKKSTVLRSERPFSTCFTAFGSSKGRLNEDFIDIPQDSASYHGHRKVIYGTRNGHYRSGHQQRLAGMKPTPPKWRCVNSMPKRRPRAKLSKRRIFTAVLPCVPLPL